MTLLQKGDLFVILTPNCVRVDSDENPNKLSVVASYAAPKEDKCGAANSWWVVTNCVMGGGGTGMGPHDVYPDGWGVTAVEVKPGLNPGGKRTGRSIFFRQSGCFNNELLPDDVRIIGSAIPPKTDFIIALKEDY